MTRAFLALSAFGLAVAACAPTASPPPQTPPAAAQRAGDPAFDAARAPVFETLRLCRGAAAYNVGPVSSTGLMIDFTPEIDSGAGPLLRNPTDDACISSGFGDRPDATGGGKEHLGIDLVGRRGSFIYAAGGGQVTTAGWRGDFGLLVEIDHGGGMRTRYAHLSELNPRIQSGAQVEKGTAIGRMGATGNASGVHLHYEVLVGGWHVDPLIYGRTPPAASVAPTGS
jgi:murein DD-endopeptidase MepM/ murein hydrolase activator NlpD